MKAKNILALDVGEKRIGMAMADTSVLISVPFGYLINSDTILTDLAEVMIRHDISLVVVGYPRNQSGEPTKQTEFVENFVNQISEIEIDAEIVYQDESLTSVQAESRLGKNVKDKGDIDAEAASIILQDYLEEHYAN